ncbi:hypothetical protein Lalb_Chr15g0078111 [Lupinus albus]|uniref:Uncharacterized protein n=1 Tax=Lupinus albus TaxID=3870 RepID=A0A6A4PCU0_LUPAL|nr:hypothetical protein Lalb_Chr15g0078111 [Lupinus albus]
MCPKKLSSWSWTSLRKESYASKPSKSWTSKLHRMESKVLSLFLLLQCISLGK